jgi:cytochrome c-type biogenesis protein CcmH/NrfG
MMAFASGVAIARTTFDKEVAPILYNRCASCHRQGQSGPFPLLTYSDAVNRAKEIVDVTTRRYMPPWLPESSPKEFLGDRRLTDAEIRVFQSWFDDGTPEGVASDLPSPPQWTQDWQLGTPDLILEMPRSYVLAPDGRDVYRNFAIPTALKDRRYVRAIEFRPDNPRIVHHAFIKVDYQGNGRKLDGGDGQAGFGGMSPPEGVKMPTGYFLSWQPGKTASFEPPGFGWTLDPGLDLVLQTHLKPTGKNENLRAKIGIYFTKTPPTTAAFTFVLGSLNIDIPAGDPAYTITDDFVLPVEADVLAVLPHTHYLGKILEGFATLPDGSVRTMLRIPNWNFAWQGDYRYAQPVHLPAGSKLQMRYLFDNSAANPGNPNRPPKPVQYGPQSSDEMAELWFQIRLRDAADQDKLAQAYNLKNQRLIMSYDEFRLKRNPKDARARTSLGRNQLAQGQVAIAIESFRAAATDDPSYDEPHYYLGLVFRSQNRMSEAGPEFKEAIRLNPRNAKAHANLGIVLADLGALDRAETSLREAVSLDPADATAAALLKELEIARSGKAAPSQPAKTSRPD